AGLWMRWILRNLPGVLWAQVTIAGMTMKRALSQPLSGFVVHPPSRCPSVVWRVEKHIYTSRKQELSERTMTFLFISFSPPLSLHSSLAPSHLITFSARMSTIGGIVRPRALAVFRLITNSNFVGCSTGRSAGLAPLRILSTYQAARL